MSERSRSLPPVRHVAIGRGEVVALVELGTPGAPPAILLAGLSDGLAPGDDDATRALLSEVPVPMVRFHGLAVSYPDPLPTAVSTRTLASDVALALADVVRRPAVVIAHSLGAMVAQHLAADHPELVAALVLSATMATADEPLRASLSRWDAWLRAGEVERFARDALVRSFTGPERERRLRLQDDEPPPSPPPTRVSRHLALSRACATHDARDRLHTITAPTLVLAGAEDEIMAPSNAAELAAAIPGARLEVLAGVGHAFPEQVPERFEELVTAFLDEVAVDGRGRA